MILLTSQFPNLLAVFSSSADFGWKDNLPIGPNTELSGYLTCSV